MDSHPASPGPSTVERLGTWLAGHMANGRLSADDVAKELGVGPATVVNWLTAAGGRVAGVNEFAHLDTATKLGAWLRARIRDSGLSVRQIAEATDGISMATIYNWLKGEHLPPPPTDDAPDRFDLLLSNPALKLNLRERLQLDEIRRRLTGTSFHTVAVSDNEWPARGLPSGNRTFTGRRDELRLLDRLLRRHSRGGAVVISALTGTGGVGKTALAVHWARTRNVRATFTDGCLYINLNGYADTPPISYEAALKALLFQLGVDPHRIPADTEAQAALYQETLTGRRLLLVLDNAHAEPQVRPLLPVDPNCLAVITSRNRLQGLDVTNGEIIHLSLDILSPFEAAALLRTLLGKLATKTTGDADIDALAATCGYLPLAIQIAAANYLTHHHPHSTPVSEYTKILGGNRLRSLSASSTDPVTTITATLDYSYRHLTDDAQRVYRSLGSHPGPEFGAAVTASATALPVGRARSLLTELAQANLITETSPGRYTFHDLLGAHAAGLFHGNDSDEERRAVGVRILDHYLHTGHAASTLLNPARDQLLPPLDPPPAGVRPEELTDYDQAMAWLTVEHPAVLTAIGAAAASESDVRTWRLVWTLVDFLDRKGYAHDWVTAGQAGLTAARRMAEPGLQAASHRYLARALIWMRRFDDAHVNVSQALELSRQLGDRLGEAHAQRALALVWERQDRHAEALHHSRQALALYLATNHETGIVRTLNSVGWLHAQLGHYAQALPFCERALILYTKMHNRDGMAATCDSLGYIHRHLGSRHEALRSYRRARDLYRHLGDRPGEAGLLIHLGDTHHGFGNRGAAKRAWSEALGILTDLEHPDTQAVRARLGDRGQPAP